MSSQDQAQSKPTGMADVRYLSFTLGPEEYALPLLLVREVIGIPEVTPVPFMPSYFLGVINLRGQVISVIDLRAKLGIKSQATSETAVIICDISPLCMGVMVDSINSVLSAESGETSDRPMTATDRSAEYITGVYRSENRLVLFLDIQKALGIESSVADSRTVARKHVG